MATNKDPLVWIDCEVTYLRAGSALLFTRTGTYWSNQMTGLDPDTDEIIEIFCLLTNGDLELLDEAGWGTIVHQPQSRMDKMDEWCTKTHGDSGLTAAVVASEVTPEQAADELLAYIQKHIPGHRVGILAGNSVHADRAFLRKEPYKKVVDHLHYRILDVSSLNEAAKRWAPQAWLGRPRKGGSHRARDDILESIEEAKYHKRAIFKRNDSIAIISATGGLGGF